MTQQTATPPGRRPNLVREAAQELLDRDFSVVPLNERSKDTHVHWRDTEYSAEDFSPSNNIAVRLGGTSGIIDIDLDNDHCREFLSFLPPTNLTFGRASRHVSHQIYRIHNSEEVRNERFATPEGEMIVELRGTGCLTMFPPSQHPDDGQVRYVSDGEPGETNINLLREAAAIMAAGVLIASA